MCLCQCECLWDLTCHVFHSLTHDLHTNITQGVWGLRREERREEKKKSGRRRKWRVGQRLNQRLYLAFLPLPVIISVWPFLLRCQLVWCKKCTFSRFCLSPKQCCTQHEVSVKKRRAHCTADSMHLALSFFLCFLSIPWPSIILHPTCSSLSPSFLSPVSRAFLSPIKFHQRRERVHTCLVRAAVATTVVSLFLFLSPLDSREKETREEKQGDRKNRPPGQLGYIKSLTWCFANMNSLFDNLPESTCDHEKWTWIAQCLPYLLACTMNLSCVGWGGVNQITWSTPLLGSTQRALARYEQRLQKNESSKGPMTTQICPNLPVCGVGLCSFVEPVHLQRNSHLCSTLFPWGHLLYSVRTRYCKYFFFFFFLTTLLLSIYFSSTAKNNMTSDQCLLSSELSCQRVSSLSQSFSSVFHHITGDT